MPQYPDYPAITLPLVDDDIFLLWRDADGNNRQLAYSALLEQVGVDLDSGATVLSVAGLKAIDVTSISDNALRNVLGYVTPGDGGGGQFFYDSTSVAADNGGTVFAPDAGSGRWLRQYSGALNVFWFGAVGDGATNDRTAIQNTINAVAGRGAVFLPEGIFRITGGLAITNENVAIYGSGIGVTFIKTDFASGSVFSFTGSAGTKIEEFEVSNLEIAANTAHTSGAVFSLVSVKNIHITRIKAGSFHQFIIAGDATYADDVQQLYVQSCTFTNATTPSHAVELTSGAVASFTDCFFNGIAGGTHSLFAQINPTRNWDGLVIEGCTAEQWPYHLYVIGAGVGNLRMSDNLFDRALFNSVLASPTTGGTCHYWIISSNILYGDLSTAQTTGHRGIYLNESSGGVIDNIKINDNLIDSFKSRGIQIGTGCTSVTANDNTITVCGQVGTPGLTVETGCVAVIVNGNLIRDPNGLMTYGVEWAGTGTGCVLGSNSISGYATDAIATAVIASATTIALPINGGVFTVTGTVNIDTITILGRGTRVTLIFAGILTVNDGSNLKIAGNFTTSADDTLNLVSDGTSWVEISRSVN